MTVRAATPADIPSLAAIQRQCPEAAQWPPNEYLSYTTVVAEENQTVIAFLVTRDVEGETEILNIAVDPAVRRRGIATELITTIAASEIFLEVRESNDRAIRLYRKLGFHVRGTRLNYYQNPSEHGLVMGLKRP